MIEPAVLEFQDNSIDVCVFQLEVPDRQPAIPMQLQHAVDRLDDVGKLAFAGAPNYPGFVALTSANGLLVLFLLIFEIALARRRRNGKRQSR